MISNLDKRGFKFRYTERQWLDYGRFADFLYRQHRRHFDDLTMPVLLRAVGATQITYGRGVSVSSLADALDLPRETVRRKCLRLMEQGWLVRDGDVYRIGERADAEIYQMIEENIDRLLSTARKLGPVEPDA